MTTPTDGERPPRWWLYLIRTADGALYTGITTDVARRLTQHAAGQGAKALRSRGPLELAYSTELGDRSLALRCELRLKRLSAREKRALVQRAPSTRDLVRLLLPDEVPPKP